MAMAFFLGANSCEGFVSLYPQLQKESQRQLFVLKGGPGCGKATCIRALCEALGGAEELFHCSSDPDSLDGAVAAGRVILDGTAPHVLEPTLPGCDGDYLTMLPFVDREGLEAQKAALYALKAAAKTHYDSAYRTLAAAAKVRQERRQTVRAMLSGADPSRRAAGLLQREVPKTGNPGRLRLRFLDGITPKGQLFLHQTVTASAQKIIALRDRFGLGQQLLEDLRDGALERGQRVYACLDPLEPGRLRHLILPDCSLAFITDEGALPFAPTRTIRLDAMAAGEGMRQERGRLRLLGKLEADLLEDAVQHIAAAHALHDRMEAIYHPHVNFGSMESCVQMHLKQMGILEG